MDISFGEILFDPLCPESIEESGCEGWCGRITHANTLFCAEQSGRCILPTPSSVYWRRGGGEDANAIVPSLQVTVMIIKETVTNRY